jgi:glutamate-1-semialdehyde 2,1-aminomutase
VRCGFHGWHDHVVSPFLSWHLFEVDRVPPEPVAGLPTYHSDGVLVWDGDDLNKLSELFEQNRGEIAALILDPVQLRNPILDILRAIRELTHRHDSLLILDELKTGFRVSLSGVQGHYGVWADIVLVGKAIANGFPLAVVLAPEWARPLSRTARLKGTFNAELVSVAAAIATTDILARPGIIEGLAKMGQRFIDGINVVVTDLGLTQHIQAVPYRWPCMPYIWFRSDSEVAGSLKQPFYTSMTSAGHLLLADHMNFMMVAHTEDDVDQTVGAAEQILSGLLGRARGADVPVTAAVRGPNLLRPTHDKLG